MNPNRVVAVAAAVLSLALAVLPVVGNFDWTSTAGVLAGLTAVLGIALTWLNGWQKHEARQATPSAWTAGAAAQTLRVAAQNLGQAIDDDEGPGDPDALPHFPAKDPSKVPPDEGDAGGAS